MEIKHGNQLLSNASKEVSFGARSEIRERRYKFDRIQVIDARSRRSKALRGKCK